MSETTTSVAETLAQALAGVDVEAVRRRYWEQNEFVYLERWLPVSLVDRMLAEVERVRPSINRNYIPRHKKGGSVSFYALLEQAPTIVALYRSPAFIEFLAGLTGRPLQPCPPGDPHSCALYFYTEPGDHIGFHFDTSYYRGARYTVLFGLIERSSSRLVCQPFKRDPTRPPPLSRAATRSWYRPGGNCSRVATRTPVCTNRSRFSGLSARLTTLRSPPRFLPLTSTAVVTNSRSVSSRPSFSMKSKSRPSASIVTDTAVFLSVPLNGAAKALIVSPLIGMGLSSASRSAGVAFPAFDPRSVVSVFFFAGSGAT